MDNFSPVLSLFYIFIVFVKKWTRFEILESLGSVILNDRYAHGMEEADIDAKENSTTTNTI